MVSTYENRCEKCKFFYIYEELDGIYGGCKKPKNVFVDCFGALERREGERKKNGN